MTGYFSMGGYAIYVWPCYGMTILVMGLNILAVYLESKKRN